MGVTPPPGKERQRRSRRPPQDGSKTSQIFQLSSTQGLLAIGRPGKFLSEKKFSARSAEFFFEFAARQYRGPIRPTSSPPSSNVVPPPRPTSSPSFPPRPICPIRPIYFSFVCACFRFRIFSIFVFSYPMVDANG